MDLLNPVPTDFWPLAVLAVVLVPIVVRICRSPGVTKGVTELPANVLPGGYILGSIVFALGCLWGFIWLIKWFGKHS